MTKQSTLKPFAPGDIFLGCTYLCDPHDDHKGDGRILQFSKDMVPKGTLRPRGPCAQQCAACTSTGTKTKLRTPIEWPLRAACLPA